MTAAIEEAKAKVRSLLRAHCRPVPPKTASSGLIHLEVWETAERSRAIGVEFDHADRVNLWVTTLNVPKEAPPSISVILKKPKGRAWTDEKGDGANSNLSAYDQFRTKPIARLALRSSEDAQFVFDYLTR